MRMGRTRGRHNGFGKKQLGKREIRDPRSQIMMPILKIEFFLLSKRFWGTLESVFWLCFSPQKVKKSFEKRDGYIEIFDIPTSIIWYFGGGSGPFFGILGAFARDHIRVHK